MGSSLVGCGVLNNRSPINNLSKSLQKIDKLDIGNSFYTTYVFRTTLIDDDRRERIYEIQFTEELHLIKQITSILITTAVTKKATRKKKKNTDRIEPSPS